jgi:large subunit ribosomal protein L11
MPEVKTIVPGGKATPAPPLGPALAPLGVNMMQVVAKINEKTKAFDGVEVPIKVIVNADKSFDVEVGSPAVAALIKKELKIEKGAGKRKEASCGDLKMAQVLKIAKMKKDFLLAYDSKALVNQIVGTCVSVGCTVEGRDPREVQKDIIDGKISVTL